MTLRPIEAVAEYMGTWVRHLLPRQTLISTCHPPLVAKRLTDHKIGTCRYPSLLEMPRRPVRVSHWDR